MDGILDEEAWKNALVIKLVTEIDPGENLPAQVQTDCLLVSNDQYFYVAFRALDPEPDKIRAHYMDRDSAWEDDWVFIVLDPFMDQR